MLILITGASKGIGFEMVKLLSNNTDNKIIAVSRNTKSLDAFIKKNKIESVTPIKADITKTTGLTIIRQGVKNTNQKLDILINNAGLLVNKNFEEITGKELKNVFTTNIFAPFLLIQNLLPFFNSAKGSHVVNISSMGGFQGSSKFAGLSAYSSSKAALCGLTECLAEELKPKKIAVNCLALGAVQTEMLAQAFPGYKAPVSAKLMAEFISQFALTGHNYFNGKILPVSLSTP